MFRNKWTRFFFGENENPVSPSDYFSALPVLETDRLVLRRLSRKDASDIFSFASDPEVSRYVLWEAHRSVSESRYYIQYMKSLYRRGLPSSWGVVLKKTGRIIGTIGFMWFSEANRSAEIGYSFARPEWNKGYATEALGTVIRSAFASLTLNRLEAQHDIRNPASGRVMEKCGMNREGILRQRVQNKGEFIDVALYAILRSDLEG